MDEKCQKGLCAKSGVRSHVQKVESAHIVQEVESAHMCKKLRIYLLPGVDEEIEENITLTQLVPVLKPAPNTMEWVDEPQILYMQWREPQPQIL